MCYTRCVIGTQEHHTERDPKVGHTRTYTTTVNRDQIDTAIELQRDGTHAYRIELAGHTFLLDPDAAAALTDELNALDPYTAPYTH